MVYSRNIALFDIVLPIFNSQKRLNQTIQLKWFNYRPFGGVSFFNRVFF